MPELFLAKANLSEFASGGGSVLGDAGKVQKDYTKSLNPGSVKGARIGIARDFWGEMRKPTGLAKKPSPPRAAGSSARGSQERR